MYLSNIHVENFKGIKDANFSFERAVNLIIGNNGTGKTSVLEAVAVALGGFLSGIDGVNTIHFSKDEIRRENQLTGTGSNNIVYKTPISVSACLEINIGDKTPFDRVSEQEKAEMGKKAVAKTFSILDKKDMFTQLVEEFNERQTPEAKFAYYCDKMECNLQAKKYSDDGRCSFENVSKNIMEDERVKKIIAGGAKSVGDVFIDYDTYRFADSDIFFPMIHFLKEYSTK